LRTASPVVMGIHKNTLRPTRVGVLMIEMDLTDSLEAAHSKAFLVFLNNIGLVGFLTLLVWVLMNKILRSRINPLVNASALLEQGVYSARTNMKGEDELAKISEAFDRMAEMIELRDAKLKESEQQFRATFEQGGFGMALIGMQGEFIEANGRFSKALGYSQDEIKNMNCKDVIAPEHWEEDETQKELLLSGEKNLILLERQYLRRDHTPIWVQSTVCAIRDTTGKPLYFISAAEDITHRKQSERLKDEFISTVSHELRTPVTAIIGGLGLLLGANNDSMNDTHKQLLELANRNAKQLSALVNDLLDFQKLESGQFSLSKEELVLGEIVLEAISNLQGYAEPMGVSVEAVKPIPHMRVLGDPARLGQVLANLVSNAVKFSERGHRVLVGLEEKGEIVDIYVTDQGQGIPPQYHESIFKPFSQVDSSDARAKEGTGLGLSVTKGLVQAMGGKISVESTLGQGSTFHVELPLLPNIQPLESDHPIRQAVKA